MKRKDFLRQMRNRRRRDELELREPERRRAIDWRTLRLELPEDGEQPGEEPLPVGAVELRPDGILLRAERACWVRGYRMWRDESGQARAEFQYRPVEQDASPPPGATALTEGESWRP